MFLGLNKQIAMSQLEELIDFMINIEYRYPINKLIGLTIFADGGILSNDISSTKLGLIKWNNGIGIAIQTPLGPARIDYAFQTKIPKFGRFNWEYKIFFEFLEKFLFFLT